MLEFKQKPFLKPCIKCSTNFQRKARKMVIKSKNKICYIWYINRKSNEQGQCENYDHQKTILKGGHLDQSVKENNADVPLFRIFTDFHFFLKL